MRLKQKLHQDERARRVRQFKEDYGTSASQAASTASEKAAQLGES